MRLLPGSYLTPAMVEPEDPRRDALVFIVAALGVVAVGLGVFVLLVVWTGT